MSNLNPVSTNMPDKADTVASSFTQGPGREALVGWCLEHVTEWEQWRKQNIDPRLKEYWMKWRGFWMADDRTRVTERSRLISPALQQAVEEALAEMEEAVLGENEGWFDLDDNHSDVRKEDWQAIRLQLLDDMDYANLPGGIVESCLVGALGGTLIAKVVTDLVDDPMLSSYVDKTDPKNPKLVDGVVDRDKVTVSLEPVMPDQFVIDTSVNKPGREGIKMALGMAHRLPRPRHSLRAKMSDVIKDKNGKVISEPTYFEVPLAEAAPSTVMPSILAGAFQNSKNDSEESNLLTEYHGLVPTALLQAAINDSDAPAEIDSREMTEAVITFVDDKYLLAARENNNLKRDRDFVASPWDIVPGSFWGRGPAEKGFNAQKALDAQLRAQIDGLSFTVHPMLGVNAQRRDPRFKIEVQPGKVLYVNGNPHEALMPLNFGRIDPTTFNSSGELERLIQVATGTAGSAAPMQARGNGTVGGMSLIRGGLAKRNKRTLRLIERHFLMPTIEKFTLRHMQYNDEVYPFIDLRFRVRTAMSLTAREVENGMLTQLLQTVPPESPVFYALLGQIVRNTSLKDKGFVLELIQSVIEGRAPGSAKDNEPEDPVEAERKVANLEEVRARTRLKDATTAKVLTELNNPETPDAV